MEFEDEEYNQFLQDLQQYPNYFQMGTENCSLNFWRKIAQKIEDEKDDLLEFSDLVRIRNQNLEACASYNLGDVDKAEQMISKVLEETNSSSINACAIMAILNYSKGTITKAKRHLSRIKELAANPYNIDVAKSELVHAYTRLNPTFYKKAIALYTEAVERNPNIIPWKYGLASIYRRCLKTDMQSMVPDLQIKTCFNEAQKHLTYVIKNCTDEKDRFFKARSYVELADLYSAANTTLLIYTDKRKIIDLVNQGVKCLPNNPTILRRAGKILRHCFKFFDAEKLLQKAYNICPNTYICHQLGLIKKNSIIYQHKRSQRKQRYVRKSTTPTFDFELSRKLDPCLELFRQSAELGQERNLDVYYDWGFTLLQMIPTKFDEVMEKFNHILAKDRSQFSRYRCYEQYGICKLRMSELQDLDEISREDYRQDAKEMFRREIRCWAYCQKLNLSKHFDDAKGNCNSLRSIRAIIMGEDPGHGTQPKRDMASLYYLVKQYGSSLSLYQEVYDELQCTSDTVMDSDVIKGIIRNHLQLQQYTGVLDLLALLLCSKEGLQCFEFKTEVLTQMMQVSIDTNDYHLWESVFEFEKDPKPKKDMASLYYLVKEYGSSQSLCQEVYNALQSTSDTAMDINVIKGIIRHHLQQYQRLQYDVAIIFNEKDKDTKKIGATLQKWLSAFSNSGLKVIKITETAANLPRHQEQIKIICHSKMAIFILANETPSTELTYLMNTAIDVWLDNDYFLTKIFPIVINDGMVPDIFKTFRSMKITHQPNTLEEQDKSVFLKTFSEIFYEKAT